MSERRVKAVPPSLFASPSGSSSGVEHLEARDESIPAVCDCRLCLNMRAGTPEPIDSPVAEVVDSMMPSVTPPSQTIDERNVYCSPNTMGSGAGAAHFSTRTAVADGCGLGEAEKVLLQNHVTNARCVVDLVQVDFSEAMRGYRVYRQEYKRPVALRLFNASDAVLLAVSVSFLLSCIVSIRGTWGGADSGDAHPSVRAQYRRRPRGLNATSEVDAIRAQLEDSFSLKVRLFALVITIFVLIVRLVLATQRVFLEEIFAIKGLGLQLTSYGVFNQIKSRRFIDLKLIRTFVIHDAFFRYQPIFFLSSSIENQPKRLVYFSETLPKLEALTIVLRGLRHILYSEEKGPSLAELQLVRQVPKPQAAGSDDDVYLRSEDSGLEDTMSGSHGGYSSYTSRT